MNGGESGTSGIPAPGWRRPGWMTAGAFVAIGLAQVAVNVSSLIDERRALGHIIDPWRVWIWEISSFAAWLVLIPAILSGAHFAHRRLNRSAMLAFHLAGATLMSLIHSAMIVGIRKVVFRALDEEYTVPAAWREFLLYEFRKDLVTYALLVLAYLLLLRLAKSTPAISANPVLPTTIEIRDGNRSTWVRIDDIDWVSAAGNYVELHGAGSTWLLRRTLNETADELERFGFVQLHRSRLVRRAAIASVETRQSGDFTVTLHGGAIIGGSRRFRANL